MKDFHEHLRGVSAILVTPYDEQLAVDHAALRRLAVRMNDAGVDCVVSCGGLAEYYALSQDERIAASEVVAAACPDALTLVAVGLGVDNAVTEAVAVVEAGADGVLVHPPVHPYVHEDGLVDYYQQICSSVDVGVVAYIRDPAVDDDAVRRIVAIDNVVGVKYAINDLRRFADLVDSCGRPETVWVCGTAEAWAPYFWQAGATGFTSGIANFAAPESLRLRDALRERASVEELLECWRPLRAFEDLRCRNHDRNSIAVVKAAAALLGLCADSVRPPMRALDTETGAELEALLASWHLERTVLPV
jgi:4-hydroxy-tetrahydrodipicolinate synthase